MAYGTQSFNAAITGGHPYEFHDFFFAPPLLLVADGYISETPPPPAVTSDILQFYTSKLLNYELTRHRIALSEH